MLGYMDTRANMKVERERLERFNELRPDDETQGEFLEALLDAYESGEGESSERIESGDSKQLDRIEELVRGVPDQTANKVEERLGRR